jgi:hypothetical protein
MFERRYDDDQPEHYCDLTEQQRMVLHSWVLSSIEPHLLWELTSFGLKYQFEESERGFSVTNGQMKGAMLAAGYVPVNYHDTCWIFQLPKALKSPSRRGGIKFYASDIITRY